MPLVKCPTELILLSIQSSVVVSCPGGDHIQHRVLLLPKKTLKSQCQLPNQSIQIISTHSQLFLSITTLSWDTDMLISKCIIILMLEHKSTLKIILTRDSMTHTITETKDNIHTTGSALSQATMPEHNGKNRLNCLVLGLI